MVRSHYLIEFFMTWIQLIDVVPDMGLIDSVRSLKTNIKLIKYISTQD
jgi:hypothetical protein